LHPLCVEDSFIAFFGSVCDEVWQHLHPVSLVQKSATVLVQDYQDQFQEISKF
jgi:hypothetical protein